MKSVILIIKIIVTLSLVRIFIYKIKTSKIKKLNITWIIKNIEDSKIIKNKLFKKLKVNCYKLGVDVCGLEFIILGLGILLSIILFNIFNFIFKISTVSLILAIPFCFIGFVVIQYLADKKQSKLEEVMNDFFIQFRGEIKVNNDIIGAFKKIQNTCLPPFNEYIGKMMTEISAGGIPEEALKEFADKVDIGKFSLFINNLKYCNTYGGNIENLTIQTQKMIEDLLKQKKKRIKETKSICIALYGLIGLDFLIYFNFISNNTSYINLMRDSFVGNLIININFISMWLVVGLAYYVKKMDL